MCLCHQAE